MNHHIIESLDVIDVPVSTHGLVFSEVSFDQIDLKLKVTKLFVDGGKSKL